MSSSVLSERAVERWQEVRFGRVRRMCQIFVYRPDMAALVGAANIFLIQSPPICSQTESIIRGVDIDQICGIIIIMI